MEAAGATATGRAPAAAAAPDHRLPLRVVVAVGIVAASTLALQVLLTRVFAAVLLYAALAPAALGRWPPA